MNSIELKTYKVFVNTKMEILENIAVNANCSKLYDVVHHCCSTTKAL